jgi:hypothetical protein
MPLSSARAMSAHATSAAIVTAQPIRRRIFDSFAAVTKAVIANLHAELASSGDS